MALKKRRDAYRITPRAVQLFRQMRTLPNCTCLWGPMYYNRLVCKSCDDWCKLQDQLHDELNLDLSEYFAIDHPPDAPPYDEIAGGRRHQRSMSHAGGPAHWDKRGELFDQLKAAAYPETAADA
jgi:hypothetical protein